MRKRTNKLTSKQREFIKFYVEKWNASRAARLAGYSERSAANIGYENLRKPHIKLIIDAYKQHLSNECARIIENRRISSIRSNFK